MRRCITIVVMRCHDNKPLEPMRAHAVHVDALVVLCGVEWAVAAVALRRCRRCDGIRSLSRCLSDDCSVA